MTSALDTDALFALGNAQLAAGDLRGAIDSYGRCLTARPQFAAAFNNLGSALIEAGRFGEAITALERAVSLAPRYVRAMVNRGRALRELGRGPEAICCLQAALELEPNSVPALINLADALILQDELAQARATACQAVALAPRSAMAYACLGTCNLLLSRTDEALDMLRRALALEPHNARIALALGHALFASGQWPEAWRLMQGPWRTRAGTAGGLRLALPYWDGTCPQTTATATATAPLSLIADQGLGDALQFARYGTWLREQGFATTLWARGALCALLRQSGLFDQVQPLESSAGSSAPATRPSPMRPLPLRPSAWFPLMNLPALCATDPSSVPHASGGYLRADPARVRTWAQRLARERRPRVGICWQGNPRAETGLLVGRSPALEHLAPLAELDSMAFYSLQRGADSEQLARVCFRERIRSFQDLDAGPDAFVDTAALIMNLDLVVTSDTAVAHLAGALGRPVWICLQKYPDWRWSYAADSTPWYASARLFRQRRQGDWGGLFRELRHELAMQTGLSDPLSRF